MSNNINKIAISIFVIIFLYIFKLILDIPRLYFLSDFIIIKKNLVKFLIVLFLPSFCLIINGILGIRNRFIIILSLIVVFLPYIYLGNFFFDRLYVFRIEEFILFYLILSFIGICVYYKNEWFKLK